MKKQMKRISCPGFTETHLYYCNREEAIDAINSAFNKAEEQGLINIQIVPHFYDDHCLGITGERLETDEEFQERLDRHEENVKLHQEQELKEYERLRKKFENK